MGGIAFVNAIVFGVYGNVQRRTTDPNSLLSHFYAGAAAGFAQSIVCAPMELAKTRLQLQSNSMGAGVKFKGPIECLLYVKKVDGFRGIFRGLTITAVRDVPGFSSYFVFYELLTRHSTNPNNAFYILMAGGLAGSLSWVFTVPIDVIKSRLQADGMNDGRRQYNNVYDCIRKSYKSEGLSFLSRGLTSTLIRAFPMNAACFYVVSWFMKTFGNTQLKTTTQTTTTATTTITLKNTTISKDPILIVNNVMSTPLIMPIRRIYDKDNNNNNSHHKRETIKGLMFIGGAFSEAVCTSEIMELGNDLYDDHISYYNICDDDNIIINESNIDNNNSITFDNNNRKYSENKIIYKNDRTLLSD